MTIYEGSAKSFLWKLTLVALKWWVITLWDKYVIGHFQGNGLILSDRMIPLVSELHSTILYGSLFDIISNGMINIWNNILH